MKLELFGKIIITRAKKFVNPSTYLGLHDWRNRFALVPAMFVVRPELYLECHPVSWDEQDDEPEDKYIGFRRDKRKGEYLTGRRWKVRCITSRQWIEMPGWSPRAMIP